MLPCGAVVGTVDADNFNDNDPAASVVCGCVD